MNFILFNGPPRSGKDTAAKIAEQYIDGETRYDAVWEKFSFPNKRAFAGMMGLECDDWGVVEPHEATKDEIIPVLGVSYRQWQIDYSEKYMKPLYGNDIFGRLLLDRCRRDADEIDDNGIYIISDCGFQIECDVLRDHNVLLFSMSRKGCDFSKDSREYVKPHANWSHHFCDNDFPLDQLTSYIEELVDSWLRKR